MASSAYGQYILTTGAGVIAEVEMAWGRFWYESRFWGKRPIADVGAGRCWFTRQNIADIIAIDKAPDVVAHYSREQLQIKLGSADNISFPDAYFEGLFCCWLLEHLAEPDRAIREFHRVLRPGGLCCLIAPTPHDLEAFYGDYTHIRPYTELSMRQLAAVGGFSRVQIQYLPWDRGLRWIGHRFGAGAADRYLRISDHLLRKVRIVNRNHLVMDAWK